MNGFVFLCMVFMHIVDDFYLQGKLAELKQKKWWEENHPEEIYRNDYRMGLYLHAFSWSFLMMLPVAVWCYAHGMPLPYYFFAVFFGNLILHACIDEVKCNWLAINLTLDQLLHLIQIGITWMLMSSPFA